MLTGGHTPLPKAIRRSWSYASDIQYYTTGRLVDDRVDVAGIGKTLIYISDQLKADAMTNIPVSPVQYPRRRGTLGAGLCRIALPVLAVLAASLSYGSEFYISPSGDDTNVGTRDQPFQTLEAARDAVRIAGPEKGATVWLCTGRYPRRTTFKLDSQDSGSEQSPVVYKAMPGAEVVFDGGIRIDPSAFTPVSELSIRKRMLPDTVDMIVQLDLAATGVDDLGTFGPRGFARPTFPLPPELFIDGRPTAIAQWPNPGEPWIPMGRVIDKGSVPRQGDQSHRPGVFRYETPRAERWTQASDLNIRGFFAWGFAEDTLGVAKIDTENGTFTTAEPHLYGFGGGSQPSLWKWCAVNLLEEIDLPGEYVIDRQSGMLYLYPPTDLSNAHIQLSLLGGPFMLAEKTRYIGFEQFVLENGRGNGVEINDAESNSIAGCTIRNLGGRAVSVSGNNNTIVSCDIYGTGAGGVSIGGGDRKTLTAAHNVVRNCDIHHLNRWYHNYHPCIGVSGVGQLIEHNHLHHCPGQGIVLSGNDHLFEYNELDHLVSEMSDQGGIYMGRNPSDAGNVFRFNFIHHTASTHEKSYGNSGIFFDDGDSGQVVHGNVFYQTGENGAVKYHGGQFNEFTNNVVVDCKMTVKYLLWNQQRWEEFLKEDSMQQKLLESVHILKPPYSQRYPKLASIFETPYTKASHIEVRNYVTSANDPVFVDGQSSNFQIQDFDAVQVQVPGFEMIPFNQIGLNSDQYRSLISNASIHEKLE